MRSVSLHSHFICNLSVGSLILHPVDACVFFIYIESGDMTTSTAPRRISGQRRRRDSFGDGNSSFLNASTSSLHTDGPGGGASGDDFMPGGGGDDGDSGGGGGDGGFVRPDMSFAADTMQRRHAEELERSRLETTTLDRSRRIGGRLTA